MACEIASVSDMAIDVTGAYNSSMQVPYLEWIRSKPMVPKLLHCAGYFSSSEIRGMVIHVLYATLGTRGLLALM
jgi:hypothetical protein